MFFCFVRQPALEGLWHLQRFKWDLYESKRNCTPKQLGRVSKSKTHFSFQYVICFQKNIHYTPIECGSAKLILATTFRSTELRSYITSHCPFSGSLHLFFFGNANKPKSSGLPPKQKETVNNQHPNTSVGSSIWVKTHLTRNWGSPPASMVSSPFDADRHKSCVRDGRSAEWSHR